MRLAIDLRLPGHLAMQPVFTPDGKYLLVTSNHSQGRTAAAQDGAIWRLDPAGAIARLCAIAGPPARAGDAQPPALCDN